MWNEWKKKHKHKLHLVSAELRLCGEQRPKSQLTMQRLGEYLQRVKYVYKMVSHMRFVRKKHKTKLTIFHHFDHELWYLIQATKYESLVRFFLILGNISPDLITYNNQKLEEKTEKRIS